MDDFDDINDWFLESLETDRGQFEVIGRFEDLDAWKSARDLTVAVYAITRDSNLSADEGICSRMRRAAIMLPANIAKGYEIGYIADFHRCMSIAAGACADLRSQLYAAHDLGWIDDDTFESAFGQCEDVSRAMVALRMSVISSMG